MREGGREKEGDECKKHHIHWEATATNDDDKDDDDGDDDETITLKRVV